MSKKIIVSQSSALNGTVRLAGAKNSALRLLAASLLTSETIKLIEYPANLLDAQVHVDMLRYLGKEIVVDTDTVGIHEKGSLICTLDWDGRSIRNNLLILGSLVSRFGAGQVPLTGGCNLGDRRYDLHVLLLERLGAKVWLKGNMLCAEVIGNRLTGADIYLPIRSTGATENGILCGVLAKGVTRIWNPHIRPEILDLISLLRKMGARINVHGQEHIEIEGVESLGGAEHEIIPDNIEAVTWIVAASITGGEIEIENFPYDDLEVVMTHLKWAGAILFRSDESLFVRGGVCYPIELSTGPHPGINSDVQPLLAAWAAKARGESRIVDLRFPGRYGYAQEMSQMGLSHEIRGDMLVLHGAGGGLTGATVRALDLRAGAALVLCGLIAVGETVIEDAWQVERGYSNFVEKLRSLGAQAEWID